MWQNGWRDHAWSQLHQEWDLIIIGGGITGAGLLREATRSGLRALLVEAQDFAAGTSSRSSKLVHGGFRYLKNFQVRTTLHSVRERERLLFEGRGLVNHLGFLLACYQEDPQPGWLFRAGLIIYDLLALKWGHRHYASAGIIERCPPLRAIGLQGGFRYFDAQTDDARLVLRVIREAVRDGGLALNYTRAEELLRNQAGQVVGAALVDQDPDASGRTCEVLAPLVINATGAWADKLRAQVGGLPRLRRLRGSHLVFPAHRLPLTRAMSFQHPRDGRFVFCIPWDGVTLVGTTDVDHTGDLSAEPAISFQEIEYLMEIVHYFFPDQDLARDDIQATFAGVRPVIGTGKTDPSKESREHVLWYEDGLLTVAGGKLTTFRLMAHDALRASRSRLPKQTRFDPSDRVLEVPPSKELFQLALNLPPETRVRLLGRYGLDAPSLLEIAHPEETEPINGIPALWAELRWAARSEGALHLDDLLLRRVRLGLLLPGGGLAQLDNIRAIVQPEMGWSDRRWETEAVRYTDLWQRCYHIPAH